MKVYVAGDASFAFQSVQAVTSLTDTGENQDPKPLTQRTVTEPLLEALGYEVLVAESFMFNPDCGHGRRT